MRRLLRPNHRREFAALQYLPIYQIKNSVEAEAWIDIGIGINNMLLAEVKRNLERWAL